ncbi:hypothetical protein HPB48_005204 [Haemaphysalis longicornis]|uniref:Uncharacterized protein n=1 Tax=Haemaphysalis longicornis TaxID=44386 RepID=A0A9J6FF83_HAELO|nr:hypothetical protein HPB48_005204 [Haemaphysalis longicornis]
MRQAAAAGAVDIGLEDAPSAPVGRGPLICAAQSCWRRPRRAASRRRPSISIGGIPGGGRGAAAAAARNGAGRRACSLTRKEPKLAGPLLPFRTLAPVEGQGQIGQSPLPGRRPHQDPRRELGRWSRRRGPPSGRAPIGCAIEPR